MLSLEYNILKSEPLGQVSISQSQQHQRHVEQLPERWEFRSTYVKVAEVEKQSLAIYQN